MHGEGAAHRFLDSRHRGSHLVGAGIVRAKLQELQKRTAGNRHTRALQGGASQHQLHVGLLRRNAGEPLASIQRPLIVS
jgi:hypothetical protein